MLSLAVTSGMQKYENREKVIELGVFFYSLIMVFIQVEGEGKLSPQVISKPTMSRGGYHGGGTGLHGHIRSQGGKSWSSSDLP